MRITTVAKIGVWLWLAGALGFALGGRYVLMAVCALALLGELALLEYLERCEREAAVGAFKAEARTWAEREIDHG